MGPKAWSARMLRQPVSLMDPKNRARNTTNISLEPHSAGHILWGWTCHHSLPESESENLQVHIAGLYLQGGIPIPPGWPRTPILSSYQRPVGPSGNDVKLRVTLGSQWSAWRVATHAGWCPACALWVHGQPPPRPGASTWAAALTGGKGLGPPRPALHRLRMVGELLCLRPRQKRVCLSPGSAWAKPGSSCLTPAGPASGKRTA